MEIRVKLMGVLKEKTPSSGTLDLVSGSTVADVLRQLDIDEEAIAICTINGQLVRELASPLAPGDELTVLPPVGGG